MPPIILMMEEVLPYLTIDKLSASALPFLRVKGDAFVRATC